MAGKSFGGSIKLTGESEYQKALRGISDNLKVLNSEMKVVTSQYDKNDNSSQKLKATSEVLNKKIAEQENKVKTLKSALAQAENETGKNSTTTKKWQNELNLAQAELNDLNKELKDQHTNLDKSSEKTLNLGDIIKGNLASQAISMGIKAVASAISSVGSALFNVGKQAVQSYAQYEQLVGGVDTLFGESSAKVQEYANNAFKTSGMSANQYMETVTSFSASLIQSLDGDTAKASEVANRAIVDMSDNANKMGTDISMIQNAYQGFAKQNYTMLDNLKLGYGGNKTEMERLIADASKMTEVQKELGITVNEGDMSFANIANAISVVQKNMGLMGTTAIEASGTITGSTGSMKSAWENLITGIADDNADFEVLVNNFVESIVGKDGEGGFLNNILPRIPTVLDGIVSMVVSLGETLLPKVADIAVNLVMTLANGLSDNMGELMSSVSMVLDTLINGILTAVPQLVPVAFSLLETLINTILSNLPLVLDTACKLVVSLAQGIADMLPTLIPTAVSTIITLVETLLDNLDEIVDVAYKLIMALADGVILALPILIECLPTVVSKAVEALIACTPQLSFVAHALILELAWGIIKCIPNLLFTVPKIIDALINSFIEGQAQMFNIGIDIVKGIWDGISSSDGWLMQELYGFCDSIVEGFKDFFGIHSPSKLFSDEIGKNLALGVGEGFGDTMGDVTTEMQGAIPTEFDTSVNTNATSSYSDNYDYLLRVFTDALKDVKVVMNNREMGAFVVETMERVVYS